MHVIINLYCTIIPYLKNGQSLLQNRRFILIFRSLEVIYLISAFHVRAMPGVQYCCIIMILKTIIVYPLHF